MHSVTLWLYPVNWIHSSDYLEAEYDEQYFYPNSDNLNSKEMTQGKFLII